MGLEVELPLSRTFLVFELFFHPGLNIGGLAGGSGDGDGGICWSDVTESGVSGKRGDNVMMR